MSIFELALYLSSFSQLTGAVGDQVQLGKISLVFSQVVALGLPIVVGKWLLHTSSALARTSDHATQK